MSNVLYVSDTRKDEIIAQAADKQTPVVLSRKKNGQWQVTKATLRDADEYRQLLYIESTSDEPDGFNPVKNELLGVAFRRGHKKCLFNTVVVATADNPDACDLPHGTGLALRWPEKVQELQRRVYQRAQPPDGRRIPVRFWPGQNRPQTGQERIGIMEDLSAGGVRVQAPDSTGLSEGDTVQIAFALRPRDKELVFDATFRHVQAETQGDQSLGFQFVGLETSARGQELLITLARTVSMFQRSHSRRKPAHLRRNAMARNFRA